jgi:hypothetical protein
MNRASEVVQNKVAGCCVVYYVNSERELVQEGAGCRVVWKY